MEEGIELDGNKNDDGLVERIIDKSLKGQWSRSCSIRLQTIFKSNIGCFEVILILL